MNRLDLIFGGVPATLFALVVVISGCNSDLSGTSTNVDTSQDASGRRGWTRRPIVAATPSKAPAPSPTTPPVASPDPEPTISIGGVSATQQAVFDRTNAFRAKNGKAPLLLNAQLTRAAQAYAEAMATDGFFSHTGLDGSSPGTRITATRYAWRSYGENIAYGYATPDAVMSGWENSDGHRANLLNTSFKEIGIGYSMSKAGIAYWVQDFGAR